MHFDPGTTLVVNRPMAKLAQVKVGVQLAIDAPQKIQIEGSGYAFAIVVGPFQD